MFPWFWWHIAPKYEFPLSGNVSQDFLMDAFFSSINPLAGNGLVEKKAFESASYGKQMGLLAEVLLPLAGSDKVNAEKAKQALGKLEKIYTDIETIKDEHRSKQVEEATRVLESLKLSSPQQFEQVMARLSEQTDKA